MSILDDITPLVLTLNEAPNICRTLTKLQWAKDIVIVDSWSSDQTLEIAKQFSKVQIFQRKFDSHASQWNYGLKETAIKTEWILALDADYVLTDEFIEEMKKLSPSEEVSGYKACFKYCINGHPLRSTVYPPVTVLYRREKAHYAQDGHTQHVVVDGKIESLNFPILHDDRKTLGHWVAAQSRYMKLEADKLLSADFKSLGWADRLRRMYVLAPFVMLFYCLFAKGLILDGWAGFFYACQRMFAELLLSLYLFQARLSR